MKILQLLRGYMRGVRLYGFLLGIMLFFAVLFGCFAFGEVQHARADLDVIVDAESRNAYLMTYFPNYSDMKTGLDGETAQKLQARLEEDGSVADVFCIRTANPVSYEGEGISIVLYEPEMLAFFPELEKLGFDFSSAPDGCVLAGDRFGTLGEGDTVTLRLSREEVTLPVAGRLQNPYRYPSLGISATNTSAQDLFADGDAVFMQATDSTMAMLEKRARRITCDSNLIVVFEAGVEEQAANALIAEIAPQYLLTSFDDIIADSREALRKTLVQTIPIPVFLSVTAFFSFFSVAVLTFKKKQRELSYLYLCGGSVKRCGLLVFCASQIFALVPMILNGILLFIWPRIPWSEMYSHMALAGHFELQGIVRALSYQHIDPSCLWVVLAYYCMTVLISLAVTLPAMKRHTPLTYLRGVSR